MSAHSRQFICRQARVLCESGGWRGVHKLTSRTSVGVLDWSCCSLALLPALTPVSCRYCWPCCRLVASTRSICSWQALKQSWNKRGQTWLNIHTFIKLQPAFNPLESRFIFFLKRPDSCPHLILLFRLKIKFKSIKSIVLVVNN